jgi:hypothetical protein
LRKQTVEPVFGIIKSVLCFRQCSLRGLKKVTGKWTPVCLAWNLKRMAKLRLQQGKMGGNLENGWKIDQNRLRHSAG